MEIALQCTALEVNNKKELECFNHSFKSNFDKLFAIITHQSPLHVGLYVQALSKQCTFGLFRTVAIKSDLIRIGYLRAVGLLIMPMQLKLGYIIV